MPENIRLVQHKDGMQLSQNNYTTVEKNKLGSIQQGAQVNAVVSVAGKLGAVSLEKADVGLEKVTNDKQIPIAGGTFTGQAKAYIPAGNPTGEIVNIAVIPAGGSTDGIANGTLILEMEAQA